MKEKYKKQKENKSVRVDERINRINNLEGSKSNPKDMERIDRFFSYHKKHIWKRRLR